MAFRSDSRMVKFTWNPLGLGELPRVNTNRFAGLEVARSPVSSKVIASGMNVAGSTTSSKVSLIRPVFTSREKHVSVGCITSSTYMATWIAAGSPVALVVPITGFPAVSLTAPSRTSMNDVLALSAIPNVLFSSVRSKSDMNTIRVLLLVGDRV